MNEFSHRPLWFRSLFALLLLAFCLFFLQACVIGGNTCTLDSDCFAPYPACVAGVCVECRRDKDCKVGVCKENQCVAAVAEQKPTETSEERTPDAGEQSSEPAPERGPDLECKPGTKRSCYGGPKGTVSNGVCKAGEQVCTDEGKWGECEGEVQPSEERCDGKDNDCNGKKDEGCVCLPGDSKDCGTDTGECKKGKQDCTKDGKAWGECKNSIEPSKEVCDNKDNDCDGEIDEGCDCDPGKTRDCGSDQGICKKGTQTCDPNGKWSECKGSTKPAPKEICNGKDDDCDGQTDEDFPNLKKKCSEGKGACLREGVVECKPDGSSGCSRKAGTPSTELCNGKDDDCDGQTDEDWPNLGQACSASTGVCKRSGRIVCDATGKSASCDAIPGASSKEICNGLDDDCDGKVDEELVPPACARQSGVCAKSVKSCGGTQGWKTCSTSDYLKHNSKYETFEKTCDGIDNNCNGSVDETFAERGKACKDNTRQGECSNGTTICVVGKLQCRSVVSSKRELCGNNKDDDCDGLVDEKSGCSFLQTTSGIVDYAPMKNGGFFVLHAKNKDLMGTCYSSTGTVTQNPFVIGSSFAYVRSMVRAASNADVVVVTWLSRGTASSNSITVKSRRYGTDCKALGAEITWPGVPESRVDMDVSVSSDGAFAGVYRISSNPTLILFDKTGKVLKSGLSFDPNKSLCRGDGYGIHIATNDSGDGIVTCQRTSSTAIHYRRFKSTGAWVDTAMVEVPTSKSNSASGDTHAVGYNNKGEYVIQWVSRQSFKDTALFFGSSKQVLATVQTLGYRSGSSSSGSPTPNKEIRVWNGDFLLRDSSFNVNKETRIYRYTSAGKLIAVGFTLLDGRTLRTRGADLFLSDGFGIQRNSLDLSSTKGLCAGKACVCVPGQKRPCFGGSYTPRGACKEGVVTCNATGTAWSACVGEVLPSPETCNGVDDDCDGRVDEDCKPTNAFPATEVNDMAASANGRLVTVSPTTKALVGQCYDLSSGPLKNGSFRVTPYGFTGRMVMVRVARDSGRFLVVWQQINSTLRRAGTHYARVYDSQCKPVSPPIPLSTGENELFHYDADIDNQGNFAIVARRPEDQSLFRLSVFDAKGKGIRTNLLVDVSKKCPTTSSYAVKVAMNPTKGGGIVTCQGFVNDPIHYRRFTSTANFVESDLQEVVGSAKNSAGTKTHAVAINSLGEFVVSWLSATNYEFVAAFYNSSGQQLKRVAFSERLYRTNDAYSSLYDRIHLMKDDFVMSDADLRYSSPISRFYRYNSNGSLLSAAFARSTDKRNLIRFYGEFTVSVDNRGFVVKNPLNLKFGAGLCGGRPCVCKPSEKRSCFNGGGNPRTPCKAGTQTCNSAGTAWGACVGEVLPTLEVCGNQKDDDCDGRVDEECSVQDSIDMPGVTDLDVDSKGQVFSVYWNGRSLLGQCFSSTGVLKKGGILLLAQGEYARYPTVFSSPNGAYTLVTWQQSKSASFPVHTVHSQIFDSKCAAISGAFAWPQGKTNRVRYDVAIDNSGNAFLLWRDSNSRAYLSMYDRTGKALASKLLVDSGRVTYCTSNYSMKVAVNPVTGDGVVTCQGFYTQPIAYRAFSLRRRSMSTSPMSTFAETNRNSSYSATHLTAINRTGTFVLYWQSYTGRSFNASFYTLSSTTPLTLKLVKTVKVGTNMISRNEAFGISNAPRARIAMNGDNFVLLDAGRSARAPNWIEYSPTGSPLKRVTGNSSMVKHSFRMGLGKTFVIESNKLKVNKLLLK